MPQSPIPPISDRSVARRIVSQSTNLFATGLILIMGMLIGRQLLDWWKIDSRAKERLSSTTDATLTGVSNRDRWIQFGKSNSTMRRTELSGNRGEVAAALRSACQSAAESQSTASGNHLLPDPWLRQVSQQQPAAHKPGAWMLYELANPLPMVVVLRDEAQPVSPDSQLGDANRCVLSWGLAFPTQGDASHAWTTFVFTQSLPLERTDDLNDLKLPASCRRFIAVSSDENSMIGFVSDLEPAMLAKDWDSMQATLRSTGEWQRLGAAWHRRYALSTRCSMDVQFAGEQAGETLGFCLLTENKE